ncbi:MAG: response regulator, partial [Clostridia bacterium]
MKNIIYIVEDDKSISDLYLMAFDSNEFEVKCFSTAESFFEELEKFRCDLILMDLMLPGMDGITAIKKLKESAMNAEIPVIIV